MTTQNLFRTFLLGVVPLVGGTVGRLAVVRNSTADWVLLALVMLGAFTASFGAGMLAKGK